MSNHSSTESIVVLSVDDDPVNQTVIEVLLEGRHNYRVVKAMDGMEALRYLETADTLPDLILLDVMMPGLSGYEVCLKIRELYPASIPIIMISAKCGRDDIVQGLNCKCNDYVTKPFDKEELLARIENHIKLNSMREAQEMVRVDRELRLLASPTSGLPQGECLVVSLETLRPIEQRRCEMESIAKQIGLIVVPSRLPIFHAISQPNNILKFVQDVVDLIESEPGNAVTIFISQIENLQEYNFESIVPVKFLSSPGFSQHLKLISESQQILGLELPISSRPSTVFCSPLLVDTLQAFHSQSIQCRADTCRIFFPSSTSEDTVDPLASGHVLLDIIPISCGTSPETNFQYSNPCCQNLYDALTKSGFSRKTSRDFAGEFKRIIEEYKNGSEEYESISIVLNDLAAVFAAQDIPEKSDIDSLVTSVQNPSLQKPLRHVLISHVRNARLETELSQREIEYSQLVKIVNENLQSVLNLESLNEMLYLEVQRRVFEVRFGS